MSTKQNNIDALRDSVTKLLTEIVSLKQTVNQQENTIGELNKKNSDITLEYEGSKKEVGNLQEEIIAHKATISKLENEKVEIKSAMKKLEANNKKKLKKESKQN